MNMKKTTLAVALSFGASFAVMEQANADVYARSYLDIDNAQIGLIQFDDNGAPIQVPVEITSYIANVENTAVLNGNPAGQMTSTCTYATCPVSDGDPTTPVLDADPSTIGNPLAANNVFLPFYGVGADEYSRADSVIWESSIISIRDGGDPFTATTHLEQIAESELQNGSTAGANAVIKSTTGIEVGFTISNDSTLFVGFDAIWNQLVDIAGVPSMSGTSQSWLNVELSLTNDATGDGVLWRPGGLGGCISSYGVCNETAPGDLNQLLSISTNPASASNSGADAFSIVVAGFVQGEYTLALDASTTTLISRVPVPGTLAILGIGFAALGGMMRRRNSKA